MKLINEAYSILYDPDKRKNYDRTIGFTDNHSYYDDTIEKQARQRAEAHAKQAEENEKKANEKVQANKSYYEHTVEELRKQLEKEHDARMAAEQMASTSVKKRYTKTNHSSDICGKQNPSKDQTKRIVNDDNSQEWFCRSDKT